MALYRLPTACVAMEALRGTWAEAEPTASAKAATASAIALVREPQVVFMCFSPLYCSALCRSQEQVAVRIDLASESGRHEHGGGLVVDERGAAEPVPGLHAVPVVRGRVHARGAALEQARARAAPRRLHAGGGFGALGHLHRPPP